MRLWSISPTYLDQKGLCGVWVEALLAQSTLSKGEYIECPSCDGGRRIGFMACHYCNGKSKWKTPYYNHPQINRFKDCGHLAIKYIGTYLYYIRKEALKRGYNFNSSKIVDCDTELRAEVTQGQLEYEFKHLQNKLKERDHLKMLANNYYKNSVGKIEPHPLFRIIEGSVASWEKLKK